MRPRCNVTGKYCYTDRHEAEYAADLMALRNWKKGYDTEMDVYPCPHCQALHVGTRFRRPQHPWKAPLHQYKHLPNPRPRPVQKVTTGNLVSNKEKTHAHARPNYIPKPRRNRTRPPAR